MDKEQFASMMDQGVAEWKRTEGAVLLDVRSQDEYAQGHVPGSISAPLNTLAGISERIPEKNTPIFTYCLSGGRSARAAAFLCKTGYMNVKNIGGISDYSGETETGETF